MIFQLGTDILFPPVELADSDGVLAYGGDLSIERLLLAYKSGIFPWYDDRNPILWWSPDPRFVVYPDRVYYSRSMKKVLKRNEFKITADCVFSEVIHNCAVMKRKHQLGTWITSEMEEAYCMMHKQGYAHSFEAWKDDKLVGGLYGISIGKVFFGESMFQIESNASKAAFLSMAAFLNKLEFHLIDSQVHTHHLESLGAEHIPRDMYLTKLKKAIQFKTVIGSWTNLYNSVTSSNWIFPFDVS
jgi:leucyl/phenylalanyl-tRNA--protein transferase